MFRWKHLFVALAALALLVSGCSDDGDNDANPVGGDTEQQATGDDSSGDQGDAVGDEEMPDQLADFPLPDDASLPFAATANSADVDPRETLAVTVNSMMPLDDVITTIGEGLEPAGYEIESENATESQAIWEFTKDGLPGNVTVGSEDPVVITINLFRSGTR